jgi:hypothetical protein
MVDLNGNRSNPRVPAGTRFIYEDSRTLSTDKAGLIVRGRDTLWGVFD